MFRTPPFGALYCLVVALLICSGCSGGGSSTEADMQRIARARKSRTDSPAKQQDAATAAPAPPTGATPNEAAATASAPIAANAGPPAAPTPPSVPRLTNPYAQPTPLLVVPPREPSAPLSPAERRALTIDNLKKIGVALRAYADANGGLLPPSAIGNKKGEPVLSWRVALLPYLGYAPLYEQFRLNEPWDSPYNELLLKQMPPVYQSPDRFDRTTNYLAIEGDQAAFNLHVGQNPRTFPDGGENTLLIVEADDSLAVPWTSPQDCAVNLATSKSGLGALRGDGFFAILGDGEVKCVPRDITLPLLRALLLTADGDDLRASTVVKEATAERIAGAAVAGSLENPSTSASAAVSVATTDGAPRLTELPPSAQLQPIPPTPGARPGIPPETELETARQKLSEVYKANYQAARKTEDRAKVAQKMLADSILVQGNAAEYYELLRIARDLAAASGDGATALSAIELLQARFRVDALEMRLKVLEDISKPTRPVVQGKLAGETAKLAQDAFAADNFAVALAACEISLGMARIQGDKAAVNRIALEQQAIETAKAAHARVPAAMASLQSNPGDPQANEIVGKYHCLIHCRWTDGLPLLAQCADVRWKVLALIDLETSKSPEEMLGLADEYWKLAEEQKQPQKCSLQIRAAHYYRLASGRLGGSLDKLRARNRLDEIVALYGKDLVERKLRGDPSVQPVPLAGE